MEAVCTPLSSSISLASTVKGPSASVIVSTYPILALDIKAEANGYGFWILPTL